MDSRYELAPWHSDVVFISAYESGKSDSASSQAGGQFTVS